MALLAGGNFAFPFLRKPTIIRRLMGFSFTKMHGLGNDFAIFDARKVPLVLSREQVTRIADRRFGIGCDQVIVLEKSTKADAFMHIYNADGGEVASCGNATRCIALLLMEESGKANAAIETSAGTLTCERAGECLIRADMGEPKFHWRDIPLTQDCDTLSLPIDGAPSAASMGNPHMVFEVANIAAVPVAELGAKLEHHSLFPDRANVSFAQLASKDKIMLRVWERGVGETLACGTAACATFAVFNHKGRVGRKVEVELPGGRLMLELNAHNHIIMTGEVTRVFVGTYAS